MPQNPSDPSAVQTEVFQLPTTCFAEENGSLVNSARWLQWYWKAAEAPGKAQSDIWIMSGIYHRMRVFYAKEGGAFSDRIPNLSWNLHRSDQGGSRGAGQGHERPHRSSSSTMPVARNGACRPLPDGSSASCATMAPPSCGCWTFSGSFTEQRYRMARRDATDPREQGLAPNEFWSWPANRR